MDRDEMFRPTGFVSGLTRLWRRPVAPPPSVPFEPLFPRPPLQQPSAPQPGGLPAHPVDVAAPPAATTAGLRQEKHILISCFFGGSLIKLYPAVGSRSCIFFSNNAALRAEAQAKGWEFLLVKGHDISSDLRICSQQAKYVKFLQFIRDFPEFSSVEEITYFDHKLQVTDEHIRLALSEIAEGKSILMRNTPVLKLSIADEIGAAMGQERYRTNMEATLRWLDRQVATGEVSRKVRIAATGFMHYRHIHTVMPLLDETYQAVWELGQPECQILWAALSQRYDRFIQRVEAAHLNPRWAFP